MILGGEKDIFPPRIIHRIDDIYADEGQMNPLLIPCAANSHPIAQYKWFWIPFDQSHQTRTQSMKQSLKGEKNSKDYESEQRRHQLLVSSRLRSLDSTLMIPGPISQSNAGHYVAIVVNNVGYDRCITTVNVRASLSIELDHIPIIRIPSSASNNNENDPSYRDDTVRYQSIIINHHHHRRRNFAIRGQTIRLRCLIRGFPLDQISWLHNTELIINNPQQQSKHRQESNRYQTIKNENENIVPASNYYYHQNEKIDDHHNSRQHQRTNLYDINELNDVDVDVDNDDNRFDVTDENLNAIRFKEISAIQHLDLFLDDQKKSGMYQCFARNRFETIQSTIQIVVIGKFKC
ncbi:hypothetical protein NH340_JMT04735 [Sarcoptes scabiei]|nr:hypothetical protein NH340_JMT04735 [Sarcoptes scabiei]